MEEHTREVVGKLSFVVCDVEQMELGAVSRIERFRGCLLNKLISWFRVGREMVTMEGLVSDVGVLCNPYCFR